MKWLITSDWHLGISLGDYDRRDDIKDSIEQIKAIIEARPIEMFFHCGDVFHNNRNLTETMKIFVEFCEFLESKKIESHFLVGNHDIVEQTGKTHAIDIHGMEYINIHDKISFFQDSFLFIPHISRSKSEISPEEQLKSLADQVVSEKRKLYVFSHCNVNFIELPNQLVLKYNHHVLPEKLIKSKNVIECWNGHFHRPEDDVGGQKNFTIVGTPQRFSVDECADRKRVILYDSETKVSESIILKCAEFEEVNLNFVDDCKGAEKLYEQMIEEPHQYTDMIVKILIKIHEKDMTKIDVPQLEKGLNEYVKYLYKPHCSIVREKRFRIKELKSNDSPESAMKKFCDKYNKSDIIEKARKFM